MFEKIMNIIAFIADVGVLFTSSLGFMDLVVGVLQTVMDGGEPSTWILLAMAGYVTGLILWSFKCWIDLKDMKEK